MNLNTLKTKISAVLNIIKNLDNNKKIYDKYYQLLI